MIDAKVCSYKLSDKDIYISSHTLLFCFSIDIFHVLLSFLIGRLLFMLKIDIFHIHVLKQVHVVFHSQHCSVQAYSGNILDRPFLFWSVYL